MKNSKGEKESANEEVVIEDPPMTSEVRDSIISDLFDQQWRLDDLCDVSD